MADASLGFDPAPLRTWLQQHGHPVQGELGWRRVGLGQSNLTYRITDDAGSAWVLRRPPLGRLLESAHDVLREARIMAGLRHTDVPVPTVLGVFKPGDLGDEAPAFLMSWVEGTVIDEMSVAEGLAPGLRRATALSLARTLAEVHQVDLGATELSGLAGRTPYAARQLRRWEAQWLQSRTTPLPALDDMTHRLRAADPGDPAITLVHGDFHLRNMITAADSGAIAAVLDWELSTLGHPLADLGSLLAYWTAPGERGLDDFAPTTLPGFPDRAEMIRAYADASGRDVSAIGFWHALGLWKLAVIAQGVLRRALDEPRNRAAAGTPTPGGIESVVRRAHAVADAAGI